MQEAYALSSKSAQKGRQKLFWEDEIHVVVSRKTPDETVYNVKAKSGHGKIQTLHRNLLLPEPYLQGAIPDINNARK